MLNYQKVAIYIYIHKALECMVHSTFPIGFAWNVWNWKWKHAANDGFYHLCWKCISYFWISIQNQMMLKCQGERQRGCHSQPPAFKVCFVHSFTKHFFLFLSLCSCKHSINTRKGMYIPTVTYVYIYIITRVYIYIIYVIYIITYIYYNIYIYIYHIIYIDIIHITHIHIYIYLYTYIIIYVRMFVGFPSPKILYTWKEPLGVSDHWRQCLGLGDQAARPRRLVSQCRISQSCG